MEGSLNPEWILRDVYSREVFDSEEWTATVVAYHVPAKNLGLIEVSGFHTRSDRELAELYPPKTLFPVTREDAIDEAVRLLEALQQWARQLSSGTSPAKAGKTVRRLNPPSAIPERGAQSTDNDAPKASDSGSKDTQKDATRNATFSVPPKLIRIPARAKAWEGLPAAHTYKNDRTWRSRPIEELKLGPRVVGALRQAGLEVLGQVEGKSEADLQAIQGIGPTSSRAIIQAINQFAEWERGGKKVLF